MTKRRAARKVLRETGLLWCPAIHAILAWAREGNDATSSWGAMIGVRSILLICIGGVIGALGSSAWRLTPSHDESEPPIVVEAAKAPARSPATPGMTSITTAEENWAKVEADLLRQYPGILDRQGDTLIIHGEARDRRYTNKSCDDEAGEINECVTYYAAAQFAVGRIIGVRALYYEGADYRLIDRDAGTELAVAGEPQLSPDGHFLAAGGQYGYGEGGDPYGLSIIAIDGPLRRIFYRPEQKMPWVENLNWENKDCLSLLAGVAGSTPDPGYSQIGHRTFNVLRRNGMWQLKAVDGDLCA